MSSALPSGNVEDEAEEIVVIWRIVNSSLLPDADEEPTRCATSLKLAPTACSIFCSFLFLLPFVFLSHFLLLFEKKKRKKRHLPA
jgi:hypothetical protein